jgi:poly(A) polymerase
MSPPDLQPARAFTAGQSPDRLKAELRRPDPQLAREFALQVVTRLREAGFAALWAGGCVRDRLLGLEPKDYDVATDAVPEQIRGVFGRRKTLAIGQAFGVITVLGPRGAGQIEVATFRRDGGYSDGRHPDQVTFCNDREDALRRDFTINGMFFDPLEHRVVDYVGGQRDLQRRLVRAIGDPAARFAEDKLRMLRAVRFAATFQFTLDPATLAAIQRHAGDLVVVSAERIGAEIRRMLVDRQRARAVELLAAAGLLTIVFPELGVLVPPLPAASASESVSASPWAAWQTTVAILRTLKTSSFSVALAALVREAFRRESGGLEDIEPLCRRLKLTAADRKESEFLLRHESAIRSARSLPWPQLQRILIRDAAADLVSYGRAVAAVVDGHTADIDYAAQCLAQPMAQLNPPPLITGEDLCRLGIPAGPEYKRILGTVRDAQLEQRIVTTQEALDLALHVSQTS